MTLNPFTFDVPLVVLGVFVLGRGTGHRSTTGPPVTPRTPPQSILENRFVGGHIFEMEMSWAISDGSQKKKRRKHSNNCFVPSRAICNRTLQSSWTPNAFGCFQPCFPFPCTGDRDCLRIGQDNSCELDLHGPRVETGREDATMPNRDSRRMGGSSTAPHRFKSHSGRHELAMDIPLENGF